MKKIVLIFTVIYIIAIIGAQYLNISICSPFNLEKMYSTVSQCNIIGIVIEEQKETENYNKFVIKVEKLYKNGKEIKGLKNTKILIKVKKQENKIQVGNQLSIKCNVKIPEGKRNYGGYSYKLYLKTMGIHAISEITNVDYKILKNNKLSIIDLSIYNIKKKIIHNLDVILSDQSKAISLGILLGDTRYISDEVKQDFEDSNLLHMLAVSGSHVAYILIGAQKSLKKVDKRLQKCILIIFLIFFIKLTGCTASVMRAGIMGILVLIAWLCKRKSNVIINISISCFIILLINPYSLFSLGFQLSYAGTLGIIFYYDNVYNIINKKIQPIDRLLKSNLMLSKVFKYIITTVSVSISANILIMPIIIYYNNTVSFTFLISNLLVSPLFGLIFLSIFFITILSFFSINLAKFISPVLEILIRILNFQTSLSAKLAVYNLLIPTPSIITIIIIYAILFILKNSNKSKKLIKLIIVLYSIIVIIFNTILVCKQEFKIYFIDVGQGDSTLIITQQNKKILIDGGGSNSEFDVGEQTLLPYLLDRKIISLDYVVISHFDSDHCKGIFTVLKRLKVKNVCISSKGQDSENYKEFLSIVNGKNINIIFVNKGDIIKIDEYSYIHVLWTGDDSISENIINNYSMMFKVFYKGYSILFTGDIEAIAEEKILKLYNKSELSSDILKVAHHGSKSSSTTKFLECVSPKIALIGVGKDNKFGHPNSGVIDRLKSNGVTIYRTDCDGEVKIIINKKLMLPNVLISVHKSCTSCE